MTAAALPTRSIRFVYPDDMDPLWSRRRPEFACAANSVSLLMPYVEPYVVKSVRAALPDLDEDLRAQARAYLDQEKAHHVQHRRLNDLLTRRYPRLQRLERLMRRTFAWLGRRRSPAFNLAFAAGFETVAYSSARWTDKHLRELFAGAHPLPATLFLWHLAEEVEHKSVAYDVQRATGGKRLTYALGMVVSMLLLAGFSVAGTLVMLREEGLLFSPRAHARLLKWSVSFVFELFPTMLVSALPGHHPSMLADPPFLGRWLESLDPATGTMPAWSMDFLEP
ncbi:MAG: hypothetical protein JWN46_1015 [Acidimicrobiales bacterium]|nr:hypothetical protein [Acidimicrobiales bacterium]